MQNLKVDQSNDRKLKLDAMIKADKVKWRDASFIWGALFLCGIVLSLAIIGDKSLNWLRDREKMPLRHILVNGELSRVTAAQIEASVHAKKNISLFSIDVDWVHRAIESYRGFIKRLSGNHGQTP